ncbi:carbonic anhydrase 1 [Orussus abietinus]|uniref:carbonic anhydrase 1 n=1 Tax=Orussus abietinus TaxID=222816 RepID=UPI000625BDE6|nr:carbonic anhydrase 1 [Orussus abietinus]
MADFSAAECLVICGSLVLVALLLAEILDWSQFFPPSEIRSTLAFEFGYADHNGPHTWKMLYPLSRGSNQSPINITTRLATVVQPCESLKWNGYNARSSSMKMINDGNSVIICGSWPEDSKPCLEDGPFHHVYDFHSMIFHWGPSDDEGSEHTLDFVRYPMEMQMVHVKRGFKSPTDAIVLGAKDGMVIVSCFFQIGNGDNPYLDHIVTNLWRVACPNTKTAIPAFPLEWILPTFPKNYYTYFGSLTQPPCNEIVTWIIHPEPIAISGNQMAEFRKVHSIEGPLLLNSRPVQKLNDREIYYHG